MTKAPTSAISLTGLTVALLLTAQAARADTEILESTAPELKVGATFKDDARLKIPDGATVRVYVTSENGDSVTKTLKGPFEGRVGDYKEERSWWDSLTGRDPDADLPMGSTRGLKATPK